MASILFKKQNRYIRDFSIDVEDNLICREKIIHVDNEIFDTFFCKYDANLVNKIDLELEKMSHLKCVGKYLFSLHKKNRSINRIEIKNNKIVENNKIIEIKYIHTFNSYCVDKDGNIFLSIENTIQKYSFTGELIETLNLDDNLDDQTATSIVADSIGNIYANCADMFDKNKEIIVFDNNLKLVKKIKINMKASIQIELDHYDNLYLVTSTDIYKYNLQSDNMEPLISNNNDRVFKKICFNSHNDMYVLCFDGIIVHAIKF